MMMTNMPVIKADGFHKVRIFGGHCTLLIDENNDLYLEEDCLADGKYASMILEDWLSIANGIGRERAAELRDAITALLEATD